MKEYKYENTLSKCPNCGGELKSDYVICPYCGSNLVGYNELENRKKTIDASAQEMNKLAKEMEFLSSKHKTKKKLSSKQICFAIGVIIFIICLLSNIGDICETISMNYQVSTILGTKTEEKLSDYLFSTEGEKVLINKTECSDELMHEESDTEEDYFYKSSFDGKNTSIVYGFNNKNKIFEIHRFYDNDYVYLPRIDFSKYDLNYSLDNGGYIKDKFYVVEDCNNADEFFLNEYVFDDNNHVKEMKKIEFEDSKYTMNLYLYISPYYKNNNYYDPHIIGIMKLDDSLFYVTEISFSNFERLNEILENPEDYFRLC